MATLIFQRASWRLQISRTSRTFAVSLTTPLPRRHRPRHLPSQSSNAQHVVPPGPSRYNQARTAFSSTRLYQAQQAEQPAVTKDRAASDRIKAQDLSGGLDDQPLILDEGDGQVDWARSFHGLSTVPFSKEAADILLAPIATEDVEVKPDGIIYLPEIKYRRILNRAFGPGGWGLAPRGETVVTARAVTREYALVVLGRLVSVARGEQDYFSPEGIPTAAEGCKSNALLRCCKDLGVASELWDPRFILKYKAECVKEVFVEHQATKKRKKIYLRKEDNVTYPFKEIKGYGQT